jgi:hypothetical protein
MGSEGRQSGRTRGRIRVRYGLESLDRTAFTMNVSETGAFIRSNNVFAPGTTLKVEFHFENRSVTLYARVVWAKKVPPQLAHLLHCGMGLRLVNPGPDWAELFAAWENQRQ